MRMSFRATSSQSCMMVLETTDWLSRHTHMQLANALFAQWDCFHLLLKELPLCRAGPCHAAELQRNLVAVVHDGLVDDQDRLATVTHE